MFFEIVFRFFLTFQLSCKNYYFANCIGHEKLMKFLLGEYSIKVSVFSKSFH